MFVRTPEDVKQKQMTMPGALGVQMRLMIGREDGAPTFAMRLFDVEPGGQTPLHAHNYEHEVLILSGSGEVTGGPDGKIQKKIQQGNVIFMPANELHQFRNTGNQTLQFMCLVPTQFDCGGGVCEATPGS